MTTQPEKEITNKRRWALQRLGHLAPVNMLLCLAFPLLAQTERKMLLPPETALETWTRRYSSLGNLDDQPKAVAVHANGDVMVTGCAGLPAHYPLTTGDFYTAKYAAPDGALLWEQRYNSRSNLLDYPTAMALDSQGNVVVTGCSLLACSIGCRSEFYTVKYAGPNGVLLWEQRYQGPDPAYSSGFSDVSTDVAVDGEGNVTVTGKSAMGERMDQYTAKYRSADGALLWETRYTNAFYAFAIAVDASGDVVVTGQRFVAKYAGTNGALLWERLYPTGADSAEVCIDPSGNVVVMAYLDVDESPPCYTAKYAGTNGALLWENRGGPGDEDGAPVVDAAGNVIVIGFGLAKYAAANGAMLWSNRFDGTVDGPDYAIAAVADAAGDIVVIGWAATTNGNEYCTAKYASADGSLLWEQRYRAPGTLDAQAGALALDLAGNVIVTGTETAINGTQDFLTVKYLTVACPLLGPPQPVPEGVGLSFAAKPGLTYTVERAQTISGSWTTMGAALVGTNGVGTLLDTNPPAGGAFYRAVYP